MQTREEKIFQRIGHCVMIVLSACAIIPMILLVMSSVTDNNTLISNGYSFFPEKFSLYAYQYIFKTGNAVLQAYGISVILTVIGTVLSLTITTLLAYALSRPGLPGRQFGSDLYELYECIRTEKYILGVSNSRSCDKWILYSSDEILFCLFNSRGNHRSSSD